jgi:radical SAM protein with 4Fe4S-binding SPASM domain
MGYVMVKYNGEVNPCMLLQVDLDNVSKQSLVSIWENSPTLTQLRQRELLKGECGGCLFTFSKLYRSNLEAKR